MKNRLKSKLHTISTALISLALISQAHAAHEYNAEDVYKKVSNSIYQISTIDIDDNSHWSSGSAVAITNNLLATNCHVALSGSFISIIIDNTPHIGFLVVARQKKDLCIIQVSNAKLEPVDIRKSDTVNIGEEVYAIGNPLRLNKSISRGIVSNKILSDNVSYLQTDASISPGSSGGGLFDKQGLLIGITTFSHKQNAGVGFAIPTELILDIISPMNKSTSKNIIQTKKTANPQIKYFYKTQISNKDRFNTSGERLTKIKDILRQDRANFYLSYTQDTNDETDSFFSTKDKREIFESAKIEISPILEKRILGNDPIIVTVFIVSPTHIIIKEGLPN